MADRHNVSIDPRGLGQKQVPDSAGFVGRILDDQQASVVEVLTKHFEVLLRDGLASYTNQTKRRADLGFRQRTGELAIRCCDKAANRNFFLRQPVREIDQALLFGIE